MHEDKSKEGFRLKLTQYLESNKCRKTPERYAIADIVYDTVKNFDAEYILGEVRKKGVFISLATVYNTLSLMASAGMVRRINVNGKYSIAGNNDDEAFWEIFRFICRRYDIRIVQFLFEGKEKS